MHNKQALFSTKMQQIPLHAGATMHKIAPVYCTVLLFVVFTCSYSLKDGFRGRRFTQLRNKHWLHFLMENQRGGHPIYTWELEILS